MSHHSTSGSPPPQGLIGIGLSLIGVVACGVASIRIMIKARRTDTAREQLGAPVTGANPASR